MNLMNIKMSMIIIYVNLPFFKHNIIIQIKMGVKVKLL